MASQVKVEPLVPTEGSQINFGATVTNVDVENLTGKISNTAAACFSVMCLVA
jgi:hypothetical protein